MDAITTPLTTDQNLVARFLAGLHHQSDIPLRVVLWNGSHHDLGRQPQVTVNLSCPASLRYFLPPSLDNLADGYINGQFDVMGRSQDVVAVASKLAHLGVPSRGRFGRIFAAVQHDPVKDAHAI